MFSPVYKSSLFSDYNILIEKLQQLGADVVLKGLKIELALSGATSSENDLCTNLQRNGY